MSSQHQTNSTIKMQLPPGPPLSLLVSAGALFVGGNIEQKALDLLVKAYGPLFSVNIPTLGPTVIVCDPKIARSVMACPAGSLISGRPNSILSFAYGSSSILLADGKPHLRMRKLLIPPFRNKDTLGEYSSIIEQIAEDFVDHLPAGKKIALLSEIRHSMLEIIIRVVFGVNDEARLAPFRLWTTKLLDLSVSYQTAIRYVFKDFGAIKHWQPLQQALAETDRLIYAEIALRRADPVTETQNDILALLLRTRTEEGDLLSDKEIRDQLATLLLAGHETTATTLAWALERILRTTHALQKLKEEFALGLDDQYAEAVIQETLRVHPPVAFFAREVASPSFELGGWNLPKGTNVIVLPTYIHQRPDIYKNPELFNPERFLDGKRIETGGWVPFGGGLHSCIGNHFAHLEIKIFLRVILSRCVFELPRTAAEKAKRQTILNIPKQGTEVILVRRQARDLQQGTAPVGCPFQGQSTPQTETT